MMGSILIAEDHAPTRYVRARMLTAAGYTIVESDSAATTLEALGDCGLTLGLVLLDVGLPDGNGFEVCVQIKATRPTLPVILISAVYRTAHARRDGLSAGADAYLVEPIAAPRLVKVVQALTSPSPPTSRPVAVLVTTRAGIIVSANQAAAALMNTGVRAVQGRDLLAFFNGDRARVRTEMAAATAGQVCGFEVSLRPRERKPLSVRVDLAASLDEGPGELEWTLEA